MTRLASFSTRCLLLSAALLLLGCGTSRRLQNVSISPPAADAKDFPSGQVQFVATGTFTKAPSPATLTSQEVTWCVGERTDVLNPTAGMCVGNIAPIATVDQNGLARCATSSQGSVFILAGSMPSSFMPDMGSQLKIFGSATLTCP
jgi:hypothetical protein